MTPDREYRRMLRWYPRAWRERNGDILVGLLLDRAEASKRESTKERFMIIRYGIAARIRFALPFVMGLVGAGAAVAGFVLIGTPIGPAWSLFVSPLALVIAVASLAAAIVRGWSRRLLAGTVIAAAAITLLGSTYLMAVARDELLGSPDRPQVWWLWLLASCYIATVAALACVSLPPFGRRVGIRLPAGVEYPLVALIGASLGSAVIVAVLLSLIGTVLLGVATSVAALITGLRNAHPAAATG